MSATSPIYSVTFNKSIGGDGKFLDPAMLLIPGGKE
jgi:hypothetical protein